MVILELRAISPLSPVNTFFEFLNCVVVLVIEQIILLVKLKLARISTVVSISFVLQDF